MKRFLAIMSIFAISLLGVHASENEYEYTRDYMPESSNNSISKEDQDKIEETYRKLELANFSYQHDVDPDQYYDMENTTWSPYPLLRLNSALYFKNITIEPGYYLLTPRKNEGNWYILFKEAGKVKHIIPVYEKDYTPETFYKDNIPEPKLTSRQKARKAVTDFAGKFKSSKRPKEKQSFLEVNDYNNNFIQLILYWGDFKYYTIFRSTPL